MCQCDRFIEECI